MKQIGNILVSIPSTIVSVPEDQQVDYNGKRIEAMLWLRDEAKCDAKRASHANHWLADFAKRYSVDLIEVPELYADDLDPFVDDDAKRAVGMRPELAAPYGDDAQEAWEDEYRNRSTY